MSSTSIFNSSVNASASASTKTVLYSRNNTKCDDMSVTSTTEDVEMFDISTNINDKKKGAEEEVGEVVGDEEEVEIDPTHLNFKNGKFTIRPSKMKELIKGNKIVKSVDSKIAKLPKNYKKLNEEKIRKGKLARKIKKRKKKASATILRKENRLELHDKVITVYCNECKNEQYDLLIKYVENEDPDDFVHPSKEYMNFFCVVTRHENLNVHIMGLQTIDNILHCMKKKEKYYLDLPVQDYRRSVAHKKRKIGNISNKSESSVYYHSITRFVAQQLSDCHKLSPLLPPDTIHWDGENYSFEKIDDARGWYKNLMKFDIKSKHTKRKYLWGSHHDHMFGLHNVNIVDWSILNDVDIKVHLENNTSSYIKVRKSPDSISNNILKLHRELTNNKGNARGKKTGDLGQMVTLGLKNKKDEYVLSKRNTNIQELMSNIGKERQQWFKSKFEEEFKSQFSTECSLPYMNDALSDFMVHSIALVNSSHYDYNDETITITTWIEETIGNTDNWYLVFPNITTDYKNATAIKLFHGCTICWDAANLRHASSKVAYRIRGGGRSAGNCQLRKKNGSKQH